MFFLVSQFLILETKMNEMNSKPRILFIHHGQGIGGAPISLVNLIVNLDKSKYDITVGLLIGGEVETLLAKNKICYEIIGGTRDYFAHNITPKTHWKYLYRYPKIYKHWKNTSVNIAPKFLRKMKPDIVHLNSHVLTDWAYAAKKMNLKVVLHNREAISNGYFGIRYRILKKLIKDNCDSIINISEDNKKRLGINDNKSIVVYNFVDIPNVYRSSMQDAENTNYKILYLGGMAYIKGFPTVVKSLKYLNPKITIQFAGHYSLFDTSNSTKTKLKNYLKSIIFKSRSFLKIMHKSNNGMYLGVLNDPLPHINACDILITPFLNEHFSRPAIEAFAYGKPVIGSNVVGMDEIISHDKNGLLVAKGDHKALAEAINYLCKNPEKSRKMGECGRQKAIIHFSPSVNTKKVEKVYDELITNNLVTDD